MITHKKQSLKERLEKLYSKEDAESAYAETLKLLKSHRSIIDSSPYRMNQKDAILITYGDSIQKDNQKHLKTLKEFSELFLRDTINTIHILPFYPYSSDDGFSVINYKEVNPDLGSWDDVVQLSKKNRLMFDAVINHISQHSEWFQGYLNDSDKYKDWFINVSEEIDLSAVIRPRALPLLSPFETKSEQIKHIWTTFSRDQVDLNYHNHHVLIAVLDVLLHYVKMGARLIRLDAIAFVWKKIGTNCIHLEETHQVIQFLRDALHQVAPEIVIITETNVPHKENISYFGSGEDEAQMVYNFALPPLLAYSIISGECQQLTDWAASLSLPSDKVCFFNFTASHDGIGLRPVSEILNEKEIQQLIHAVEMSGGLVSMRSNGDGTESPYELNCNYMDLLSPLTAKKEERVARMLLSQGVALTMPGVPGIYIHSLLGSRNDIDSMMRTNINRSINREKLNWNALMDDLQDDDSHRNPIFQNYRNMLSIRTKEPAFDPFSKFDILSLNKSLFAMVRYCPAEQSKILVLANFSHETLTVKDLPYRGPFRELLTDREVDLEQTIMAPFEQMWIKLS